MLDNHDHGYPPVHPRDRELRDDDPMLLRGVQVDGDPLVMLDCLVEEFARMGYGKQAILDMFADPFYQGPFGLRRALGDDLLRDRIEQTLSRCGTMRVRTIELDDREEQTVEAPVTLTIHGQSSMS